MESMASEQTEAPAASADSRPPPRKRSRQDAIYETIVNNLKVGRLGQGRYCADLG